MHTTPRYRARLLALALLPACAAHAQVTDLEAMRQYEERERLEQEILRQLEEQQRRERDAAQRPAAPTPGIPDLGGHEFHIDRVYLQGEARPPSSRRRILARYEGRTLGATQMLELVRELMNDYARQGYATTTVVLLPQNLKAGHLVLGVQWGRVKGWRFSGREASTMGERAMRAMLPDVDGAILDMAAVDQAVEALNNGKQSATVNIVPADETGYSWLDIDVQPRFPVGGNLGVDNSGPSMEPGDGRLRTTVGASVRGFGAEVWNVGATRRHYFDGYRAIEDSRNIALNVPLGFWDLEMRHGDSSYERPFPTNFGNYVSTGASIDQTLKINRMVSRSKEGKTDVNLRIQRKDNENFIRNVDSNQLTRLDVNSKVYADLVLGVSRVESLWGGSLYADAQWSRGTRWLGANDVTISPNDGDTKALYYKYSGNLSWTRGFAVGTRRVDLGLRGGWQYTPRELLSANKLTVGDEYTVRGFKGNSVMGDKGGYLSSTLTLPIAGGWSALAGADVGAVQDNIAGAPRQTISGWAVGVRGNWRNASLSIIHAEPIKTLTPEAGNVLYAMATLRF